MLSKLIKDPPPFNLTLSALPDAEIEKIVMSGGEKVGRSPKMPAWEGEITPGDVDALKVFLKSIRKY